MPERVKFDAWLDERGFTAANPPDEVWIGATMSYWWADCGDVGDTRSH
jgi:hypothetical protein